MESTTEVGFFRRAGLPALLALAGIAWLFYPFFLQGYVLDANHDRRDISVPFALICHRAAQTLSVPEWNPYIFAGTSAIGSGAYVCFYPVNWIAFALPERLLPQLLTAILVLHVALAFWFSHCLFRRLGGDWFWATVAAMLYVFSSAAIMQMTAEINFTAFVFLPLALYMVAAPSTASPFFNVFGQAFAYALLILGGNPQLAIYAIGISVAFGLDRVFWSAGPGQQIDLRTLGRNMSGLVLGLMLAAPRLVPFAYGAKEAGGARVSYDAFRAMSPTRPTDALRFLMPEVYGSSLHESFFGSLNHFETFSAYVGVAGGIMALYAVLFVWRRRTVFWNVTFMVIVLAVLGTPLTWIHYIATGRSQLLYNRLAWFLPICAAALVAVHGPDMFPKRRLRIFSLAVLVTASAALCHLVITMPEPVLIADHAAMIGAAVHFGAFFLLFFVGLVLRSRGGPGLAMASTLLLGSLTCDLLLVARRESGNSNPFLSPAPLFQPTRGEAEAAEQLRDAHDERRQRVFRLPPDARTSSYDKRTINNRFIYLGLYSSSGYDNYAPPRIARLYSYPSRPGRAEERIVYPSSPRVAELAATSIVLTDATTLIRLPHALPRARLFTRYEVMTEDQALRRILDPAFDPLRAVVLTREPDRPVSTETEPGTAEIVVDTGSRVEINVAGESSSILLLADTFYPGWQAEVDGGQVPILEANYAFRAVAIPAGSHRVVWRFRHPGAAAGAWIGVAGLSICAALVAAAMVSQRRTGSAA